MPTRRWWPRCTSTAGSRPRPGSSAATSPDALSGAASAEAAADAKSVLQEMLQARGEAVPEYVVVAEEGPDHRKQFRVRCLVGGAVSGEGVGYSKKEAQQEAARRALAALRERQARP